MRLFDRAHAPAFQRCRRLIAPVAVVAALLATAGTVGGERAVPPPPGAVRDRAATDNRPQVPDPLARPMRLSLWGATLDEAVAEFTLQARIDLRVGPSLREVPDFAKRPLYLLSGVVDARTALELLARALGCRYYVPEPGRVNLVAGYDWLRDDESPRTFQRLNPRHDWQLPGDDPERTDGRLLELAKAVPVLEGANCSFRVVRMPMGNSGETQIQLEGALPPTLHRLVSDALQAAARPPPPLPREIPPAPPTSPEVERLDVLVDVRYENRPLREILDDISLLTGLTVGFEHGSFNGAPPPLLTLKNGLVPAREALAELSRKLGLGGASSPVPGVVWLDADADGWNDAPAESRELRWHGLKAFAYPAAAALPAQSGGGDGAVPTGDELAMRLRRTVMPGLWRDPMTALVHNPRQQSLIVIAPEAAHLAVIRELDVLAGAVRRDGRWPSAR